jgi:hypothetical protein
MIEHLLKKHNLTKKFFGGVYCSNTLPKIQNVDKKIFFVVNLDPSYKNGSHWVVIMLNKKGKKNIYFDSYGLAPKKYGFKKYMHHFYKYNSKKLQHHFSTCCGQWCMYFILEKCKGKKLKKITEFFGKNFLGNDHIMNLIVEREFKTDQKVIDKKFLKMHISKTMAENLKM